MMSPPELALLAGLTALAVLASLHAWRARQTYGLFRFLAFERIVLLIVWNADAWFRGPFSLRQIASWTLMVIAVVLAGHGFYLLRAVGGAQARLIENTRTLVEVGVYRYIRHPLYAALILFGWGVFLKRADTTGAILAWAETGLWFLTARYEERFNIDSLGATYSEYVKRTRMFLPFLF